MEYEETFQYRIQHKRWDIFGVQMTFLQYMDKKYTVIFN
jgi:hypothetical protein